jgi:hypothetical protein
MWTSRGTPFTRETRERSGRRRTGGLVSSRTRIPVLLDAIASALKAVASVPLSDDVDRFIREADSLRMAVESWEHSAPTPELREDVMQRLLRLHTSAAKLRRETRPR